MFFELDLNPKDRAASRFIGSVRKLLARAVFSEKENAGVTQQLIAEKLGVNRSVVNRMLKGEANLTLRSVAELAWALGMRPELTLNKIPNSAFQNNAGSSPLNRARFSISVSSWSPQHGTENKRAIISGNQYGINDNFVPVEVAA